MMAIKQGGPINQVKSSQIEFPYLFYKEFKGRVLYSKSLQDAPQSFKNNLIRLVLSKENNPASRNQIKKYFGPWRMPGTSSIGLRHQYPELFQDTLDSKKETYDNWLKRTLTQTVNRLFLKQGIVFEINEANLKRKTLIDRIKTILELEDSNGFLLRDLIPQQIYEDVFIHMALIMLSGHPAPEEPCLYLEFNEICHRLAMTLINFLDKSGHLKADDAGIEKLIKIAVLSGYAGINLKTSASAASTLLNRECIPIDPIWIKNLKNVYAVAPADIEKLARRMMDISEDNGGKYGIDAVAGYFEEVVDTAEPTLLAFFSDDYMETIIDLKRFEIILSRNPFLSILFIPRNGRYGNDFAFEDASRVIRDPAFTKLAAYQKEGRFYASESGPKAGCIDPRFISENLIGEMELLSRGKKLIFETKGCRNFEMLQGQLTVPWYTSFNCNRALSIRTVGIDLQPVFIRIPPGSKAYDGFDDPVIGVTPSGETRGVRFARMTTRDLYDSFENESSKTPQKHHTQSAGT